MQRRSLFRLSASLALVGSGFCLAACGGGGGDAATEPAPAPPAPPAPPPVVRTFAYVANYASADVSIFEVAETGSLTEVGTTSAGAGAHSIAIHPSGRYAYAANEFAENISLYEIQPATGMLVPLPVSTVEALGPLDAIQIHPSGKFAYVNHYADNSLSIYTVNGETGMLTFDSSFSAGALPICSAVDPSGRFLFVALDDDRVLSLEVDTTTGRLTVRSEVTEHARPIAIAVAPSGRFLYVAVRDSIVTRAIAADGQLGAATPVGADEPRSISIGGAGRLVCVTAGTIVQEVAVYAVDDPTTGVLSFVASVSIGGGVLNSSAISPSGNTVYAITSDFTGSGAGSVVAFSVNEGARELTEMAPSHATGVDPFGINVVNIAG